MNFKTQMEAAEAELLKLEQQKADIERQMQGWVKIIEGLRVLSEREKYRMDPPPTSVASDSQEPASLPAKILAVLSTVSGPIGATQIRDQVIANRAASASDKNLLINIHTTLKRLIKYEQVEEVSLSDGSKLYRFVTPMERALRHPYGAPNSLANRILQAPRRTHVMPRSRRPSFGSPPVTEDT
jgi:hypothetical protein